MIIKEGIRIWKMNGTEGFTPWDRIVSIKKNDDKVYTVLYRIDKLIGENTDRFHHSALQLEEDVGLAVVREYNQYKNSRITKKTDAI